MSWELFLEKEKKELYFINLMKFIEEEKCDIYPKDIFRVFKETPLDKIKVVIIGQDPYHNPGQANGLAFAVNEDVDIPPSLKNIMKEYKTKDRTLISWAHQGVFLLNTVLTVRSGVPKSHSKKGWEKFTDRVIEYINYHNKDVIFLLWGREAQKKASFCKKVFMCAHPSPLGASSYAPIPFCDHSEKVNKLLVEMGKEPIKWS